jgi:hypothetical protein
VDGKLQGPTEKGTGRAGRAPERTEREVVTIWTERR